MGMMVSMPIVSAVLFDSLLKVIPTILLFRLKQSGWSRQEIAMRAKTKNQSVRLIMRNTAAKIKPDLKAHSLKTINHVIFEDFCHLQSSIVNDFWIRVGRANFARNTLKKFEKTEFNAFVWCFS